MPDPVNNPDPPPTPDQEKALNVQVGIVTERVTRGVTVEARVQYVYWLHDGCSPAKAAKIKDVFDWVTAIWAIYYNDVRTKIMEGDLTATMPPEGCETYTSCPWSVWDIASTP